MTLRQAMDAEVIWFIEPSGDTIGFYCSEKLRPSITKLISEARDPADFRRLLSEYGIDAYEASGPGEL